MSRCGLTRRRLPSTAVIFVVVVLLAGPLLLLVPFNGGGVGATDSHRRRRRHVSTDSFPPDAEYDPSLLDPYHWYGAPYGGFSRSTASRLAALPLYLPDISEEALLNSDHPGNENDSALYLKVRDSQGRPFACRVYHEDELEPDSLEDSMFDAPRLRATPATTTADGIANVNQTTTDDGLSVSTTKTTSIESKGERAIVPSSDPLPPPSGAGRRSNKETLHGDELDADETTTDQYTRESAVGGRKNTHASLNRDERRNANLATPFEETAAAGDAAATTTTTTTSAATSTVATDVAATSPPMISSDKTPITTTTAAATSLSTTPSSTVAALLQPDLTSRLLVADRLAQLDNLCGQIHKGWWSYEWCYEGTVSQFHIDFNLRNNEFRIDGVRDLGTYESRSVEVDFPTTAAPNHLAEDTPELARVLDVHSGGGICDETGEARRTVVHMLCCSATVMLEHKGLLHRKGQQVTSNIVAVVDVEEDPDVMCAYTVTICTPLLCRSSGSAISGGLLNSDRHDEIIESSSTALSRSGPSDSGSKAETADYANESIREILDRTLKKTCLQTSMGGWWTYEFCYENTVRQFHQVAGISRDSSGVKFSSKQIESAHVLGQFDVVADQNDLGLDDWKRVVNITGAMAAVSGAGDAGWGEGSGSYYQVEYTKGDVCDHTDVTDSAIVAGSVGGVVERSSSVQFFCGATFDVAVHEDSTCHYVVKVKVPTLCKHPLFRAPVFKKQVMKCLPVEEEY